jgi:hypothetical protein
MRSTEFNFMNRIPFFYFDQFFCDFCVFNIVRVILAKNMPKYIKLTVAQKTKILALASQKVGSRSIARQVGCDKTAMLNCIKNNKKSSSLNEKREQEMQEKSISTDN